MKQTERSAVLGFLMILLMAVLMGPGCKPASSDQVHQASVKERLAVVERASVIEPFNLDVSGRNTFTYTFTVVFSYHEDIPGFQKVVLKRSSPGVEDHGYFAGLASKAEQFQPGEEVNAFIVAYVMNEAGYKDRFLLVRKKE